jgi:hypothetical protein
MAKWGIWFFVIGRRTLTPDLGENGVKTLVCVCVSLFQRRCMSSLLATTHRYLLFQQVMTHVLHLEFFQQLYLWLSDSTRCKTTMPACVSSCRSRTGCTVCCTAIFTTYSLWTANKGLVVLVKLVRWWTNSTTSSTTCSHKGKVTFDLFGATSNETLFLRSPVQTAGNRHANICQPSYGPHALHIAVFSCGHPRR